MTSSSARSAPAEIVAMLLADARLPVAGHTQSAGLEPALADGMEPADVPVYLELRLATVTAIEAGTAVVALHHLRAGHDLASVVEAWTARTPSPALREVARHQGRALLRLLVRLWPHEPAIAAVAALTAAPRAVVLAAAAQAGALRPITLARIVGYDDVQTVVAAALKLTPMDPADATAWVLDAAPGIEAMAERVATLTDPDRIPRIGSPQIEAWAQAHAVSTRRLFRA